MAASASRGSTKPLDPRTDLTAPTEVERRSGDELTVDEFRSTFVAAGRPVVITGVALESLKGQTGKDGLWDIDLILQHAGMYL